MFDLQRFAEHTVSSATELTNALSSAADGDTIKFNANFTFNKYVVISKNLTFDLNGHDITGRTGSGKSKEANYCTFVVGSGGTLTVEDNSSGAAGKITAAASNAGYSPVYVKSGGNFILKSGTIANTSQTAVKSEGSVSIVGGTISGMTYGFINNGSVTVSGGTIKAQSTGNTAYALYINGGNYPVLITGGTIEGAQYGVYNYGVAPVTVSGGTISAEKNSGVYNKADGTINISGAASINGTQCGIRNSSTGKIDVSGGSNSIYGGSYGVLNYKGTVQISGDDSTITGGNFGVWNYGSNGTINISGKNSSIYGGDRGIANQATCTLNVAGEGSTISGGTFGIFNSGNTDKNGYVNISGQNLSISGGTAGIQNDHMWSDLNILPDASATITGGSAGQGILTNGTLNISLGSATSIYGGYYGIFDRGKVNIAEENSSITGGLYGIYNQDRLTVSGGIITGDLYFSVYNAVYSTSGKNGVATLAGGTYNEPLAVTPSHTLPASDSDGIGGYIITGNPTFKSNPLLNANSILLKYDSGLNTSSGMISFIGAQGWNETTTQGQYFYLSTADSVYGSAVVSLAGVNVNGYESVGVDTANSVFAVPTAVTLSSFATTGSQYQFLQYTANKTTASELKSDAAIVIDSDKLFGATTTKIDGSENAQAMSIIGGNGVTEITGGTGADSLIAGSGGVKLDGGTGKDTLTGGAGNDTFIYNGGENLIKNYGVDDIVNLDGIDAVTSGKSISSDANGFTIAFGTGNSLTFAEDVEAKVRSEGQLYTYSKDAIALNKSVTLTAGATSYSLDGDNTYNAVNALAAKQAVSLIGNAFANTLTAGDEGSTLDGKDGNDNLYGGAKADVFIYGDKSGKDAIYGYSTADSLKVTTDKIISGTANSNTGELTFKIDNSNSITFKPADDGTAVEKILLADSTDSLTKDGRIKDSDKMLELFSEQKGRINLADSIYSGVAGIDASKITDNVVTMTGGSLGGAFIFANNKKKADVFEYGGGAVSLSGYTTGVDKIDLGAASLQSFTFGEGSAVSLTTDKGVISLDGAQGKEVLLHDVTGKNNSFSKMIFFANGVLHDKEKNPTAAILSYGAGGADSLYSAASTIKKITVGNDVTAISVQASSKNTVIDASNAGADVTLIGGKGNDKFTGREGADTFVYTAGKDIITNYEVGDSISAEGFDPLDAKITQSRKSVTLKFSNKNSLAIKSDEAISTININGTAYNFGKNAVISGGAASLTSNFSGTYKAGEGVTLIDGSAISKKNFTMQGTKSADTLIGGSGDKKKVTFKGGGATSGADSLVGGASKDTFFYAKNDTGAAQVTNFDYANDNVKIKRTLTDINKTNDGLEFEMSSGNTLTLKTDNKNNNIGSSNVLIKANNTLYWFEGSGDDYGLYTAKDKDSKAAIKTVLRSKDSYAIVDLNYSTNLVKGKVADVTETVFTSTMADNYKIK